MVLIWNLLCRAQRVQPIVVDPAIYLARRSQIFHATQKRKTPDAFKVFTGTVYFISYHLKVVILVCFTLAGNAELNFLSVQVPHGLY